MNPSRPQVILARWRAAGEHKVARGRRRCFGIDTAMVALADNPVGRLVEDLMLQGSRRMLSLFRTQRNAMLDAR
jgi:hypothetical protein